VCLKGPGGAESRNKVASIQKEGRRLLGDVGQSELSGVLLDEKRVDGVSQKRGGGKEGKARIEELCYGIGGGGRLKNDLSDRKGG